MGFNSGFKGLTEIRGPRIKAIVNVSEHCTACCHAKRSELKLIRAVRKHNVPPYTVQNIVSQSRVNIHTTAQLRYIITRTHKIMSLRSCSTDKSQINNNINKENNVPASFLESDL